MQIQSVSKRRKGLTCLTINGEEVLIDTEVALLSPYKAGAEISAEELEQLQARSDFKRAKERALWYLSRGDLSEKGLYDKLARAFSKPAAAAAVARIKELGLVNDHTYARRLARAMVEEKHLSARMAAVQMMQKGIPRQLAQEALAELEPDNTAAAVALIEKKYKNKLSAPDDLRRTYAALLRRGFTYSEVRAALAQYNANLQEFEGEDYAL